MGLSVVNSHRDVKLGHEEDLKDCSFQSLKTVLKQLRDPDTIILNSRGNMGLRMTHKEYMSKFGREYEALGYDSDDPEDGNICVVAQPVLMAIFLGEYALAGNLIKDKNTRLTYVSPSKTVCMHCYLNLYEERKNNDEAQLFGKGSGDILNYAIADPKMPDDLRLHIFTQMSWERKQFYGMDKPYSLRRLLEPRNITSGHVFPMNRKNMDWSTEAKYYREQSISTLELILKRRKRYFSKTSVKEWKHSFDILSGHDGFAERVILLLMKHRYKEQRDRLWLLYYYFEECNTVAYIPDSVSRWYSVDKLKLVEKMCRSDKEMMQIFSQGVVRAYVSLIHNFVCTKVGTVEDIQKGNYSVAKENAVYDHRFINELRDYARTMTPKGVSLSAFLDVSCLVESDCINNMSVVYPDKEVLLYAYKSLTGNRVILDNTVCQLISDGKGLYDFDEQEYMKDQNGAIMVMNYDYVMVGIEEAMSEGFKWVKQVDEFRVKVADMKLPYYRKRALNTLQRELIDYCAMDLFIMAIKKGAFADKACFEGAIAYATKVKLNGDKVACLLAHCT